jgi:hypothetical protein
MELRKAKGENSTKPGEGGPMIFGIKTVV